LGEFHLVYLSLLVYHILSSHGVLCFYHLVSSYLRFSKLIEQYHVSPIL
jgi:hypothetical protein